MSKYLNAYIGSAFGRGVPIFGTSMIDDSVLMDMQKEINTAIEVATVATGIDIRGHIVASNFFIVICCNGSSIVGPEVFDTCNEHENISPKALAFDAIFSRLFDLQIVPPNKFMKQLNMRSQTTFFAPVQRSRNIAFCVS